jgi:hypothetical protein
MAYGNGSNGPLARQVALNNPNRSDPQPPRWRLPLSHQESLRSVLDELAPEMTVTAEQRAVIRRICAAPERQTFEPEDFLIAFKLALVEAANAVRIPPGPERNDFLARMVSVYIEEFYRAPLVSDALKSGDGQDRAPQF